MVTILVVDDDNDLLEMVKLTLQTRGFNVIAIESGNSFFERVIQAAPTVILMDVFLGDHDGLELCRRLKQSDQSSIPVILYSAGNISRNDIDESMADAFLQKPFMIKDLTAKIESFVNN